nr:gustatory receptor [Semanotus bifasciatus]
MLSMMPLVILNILQPVSATLSKLICSKRRRISMLYEDAGTEFKMLEGATLSSFIQAA